MGRLDAWFAAGMWIYFRSMAFHRATQAATAADANNNGLGATDPTVLDWALRYELLSLNQSNNRAFVYNNVDMENGAPAQMLIGPQFADGGPQPAPEPQTLVPAGVALIAMSLGLRRRIGKR